VAVLNYNAIIKVVVLLFVLVFVSVSISGCADNDSNNATQEDKGYVQVNQMYIVKEPHIGHSRGVDYITVAYYDGEGVSFINNDNYYRNYNDYVQINVFNTNETVARLVYVNYTDDTHAHYGDTPRYIYNLYMPLDMHFTGTSSEYENGRSLEQSTMS
jgi:hypothetical protein